MKQKDSKNLFKLHKFQVVGPRTNSHAKQGLFAEKVRLQETRRMEKEQKEQEKAAEIAKEEAKNKQEQENK